MKVRSDSVWICQLFSFQMLWLIGLSFSLFAGDIFYTLPTIYLLYMYKVECWLECFQTQFHIHVPTCYMLCYDLLLSASKCPWAAMLLEMFAKHQELLDVTDCQGNTLLELFLECQHGCWTFGFVMFVIFGIFVPLFCYIIEVHERKKRPWVDWHANT